MKPKIIFTDIDWTIYDHSNGHNYDIESINALKKAQEKGILVFLCTARPFHSVKQTGLFDYITPDGMILCNGGLIIYQDKVIFEKNFTPEKFEKLCEEIISLGLTLEGVEAYNRFLIAPSNEIVDACYGTFYEETPEVEDYHNRKVISALLFSTPEYDEKVIEMLPEGLNHYRFFEYGVDIVEFPHDKGEAVAFTLNYLKIDKKDSVSFGDDIADISMFENTGVGVAVANAKQEVLDRASFISKSVMESGVEHALKTLKII